jgi:hypothetical protein
MDIFAEVWPRRTKLSHDYSYTDTFIGDSPEGVRFTQKLNQGKEKTHEAVANTFTQSVFLRPAAPKHIGSLANNINVIEANLR